MANQVSYDNKGIFHIIDDNSVHVFRRTEGVVENGSPDVAGWETSYLITAKLTSAGQGTPTGAPGTYAAATVDGSTGVLSHS
jgi:hypothetical protein